MSKQYQKFQPGEYLPWESRVIEPMLRNAEEVNEKLSTQAPECSEPITEEELVAYNRLWNPYDRLYTDTEYARSLGLPGVPAYPGFGKLRGTVLPGVPKDIADEFYYTNDGHDIRFTGPIFAGDRLCRSTGKVEMKDITPPGSELRQWYIGGTRNFVDQHGRLMATATGNTRDCYKKYTDGSPRMDFTENMTQWTKYFPPAHVTTESDWERIRAIWAQEEIRDEDTPYWEDVDVGYELPKTCTDGPVTYMHINYWHYIGDLSIFTREELSDPEYLKTVFHSPYGSYLDETALHFSGRNLPGSRLVWYNNTGANLIARTVTNFVGAKGYISRFCWRFFPFFKELRTGPIAADMFNKIPGMEGRDCDRHGSEGDTCIGRAVVTGKHVNERGEHVVEFGVWGEDLEGNILQACPMAAVLPSRKQS